MDAVDWFESIASETKNVDTHSCSPRWIDKIRWPQQPPFYMGRDNLRGLTPEKSMDEFQVDEITLPWRREMTNLHIILITLDAITCVWGGEEKMATRESESSHVSTCYRRIQFDFLAAWEIVKQKKKME